MLGKVIPLAVLAASFAAAGCSIQPKGSKGNEDVKIETPFGGVRVKTDDAAIMADIGIRTYPGATLLKQNKDNGAADIHMSAGDFHLRVEAVGLHTADPPEKVLAFYRKELARYGDVIECKGKLSIGKPSKTNDGLACEDSGYTSDVSDHADIELKVGGKLHQHIAAVEKTSDGTKIGLVVLELPNVDSPKESN